MKNERQLWEDFLFENRNKAYGAYELRTSADRTLLKALLSVVFALGLVIVAFSSSAKDTPVAYDRNTPPVYKLEKIEEYRPPVPPEKKIEMAKPIVTIKEKSGSDVVPKPVANAKVETPVAKQDEIGIAKGPEDTGNSDAIGAYNPEGDPNATHTNSNGTSDTGAVEPKPEAPKTMNVRQVTKMAVFPGCENAGKSKKELTDCMSAKLNEELSIQMRDFEETASKSNISKANAQLNFVVDKSGRIVQVQSVKGGNDELSAEARKAMDRISKRLIQKGKYIKPAEMDDGTVVNMVFSIPVRYNAN